MGHQEPSFFFFFSPPFPHPCCCYCCFEVGYCYTDLATLNMQCRIQEPWICGHFSAVRTAAMHHHAWSLCLCFGDHLQLWCLSTCWLDTLTLEVQRAGQRGGSLRAEGRGTASVLRISSGDYSCRLCIHHPPWWETTLQQAFKLDREQLLSKAKTQTRVQTPLKLAFKLSSGHCQKAKQWGLTMIQEKLEGWGQGNVYAIKAGKELFRMAAHQATLV